VSVEVVSEPLPPAFEVLTGEDEAALMRAAAQMRAAETGHATGRQQVSPPPPQLLALPPAALRAQLGARWWEPLTARMAGWLYAVLPRRPLPGQPALLLFNAARSGTLAGATAVTAHFGFNAGWEVGRGEVALTRLPAAPGASSTDEWWVCEFPVPAAAYEMHWAVSGTVTSKAGSSRVWENNNGSNFYARCALPPTTTAAAPGEGTVQLLLPDALQAINSDHQAAAHKAGAAPFFTLPCPLVAGAPALVFFNRARAPLFRHAPNLKLHHGWNGWDEGLAAPGGSTRADFKPTALFRDEKTDWWSVLLEVPASATTFNFDFTDGSGAWDNNRGGNYELPVLSPSPSQAGAAGGQQQQQGAGSSSGDGAACSARIVQGVESRPHGAGTLHVVTLAKRSPQDRGYTKSGRWSDERTLRVWTPPGWSPDKTPAGGWPTLYLTDGQNAFEDWLAHQGVSWRAGYTASDLITAGELPPFIVVGIDAPGPMRSLTYLPYPPGSGAGGFRGDCERWPGGGVASYMARVTTELMPLVTHHYGASTDPARLVFGGGSFGGVAALYAALHYPHTFGGVLAESPSLWVAEARFLADLAAHSGALPERLFMGVGTREYSGTRDHERADVDGLLLHYAREAARILDEKGMRPGQGRLVCQVEEGAGHHEGAWAYRLTGALRYLCAPWWQEVAAAQQH